MTDSNRDRPASGFKNDQYRDGLTKREAAAIAAMQGCYALGWKTGERMNKGDFYLHPKDIAKQAVLAADALFDELDKEKRDE